MRHRSSVASRAQPLQPFDADASRTHKCRPRPRPVRRLRETPAELCHLSVRDFAGELAREKNGGADFGVA